MDYFNSWTEYDEERLFTLLSATPARFILSTWHHNDYRTNLTLEQYWNRFNIVTREHFYHTGGKLENRREVVEALVFNFEASMPVHTLRNAEKQEQYELFAANAKKAV